MPNIQTLEKRCLFGGAYDLPDDPLPYQVSLVDSPIFYKNSKICIKIGLVGNAIAIVTTALTSWLNTLYNNRLPNILEIEASTGQTPTDCGIELLAVAPVKEETEEKPYDEKLLEADIKVSLAITNDPSQSIDQSHDLIITVTSTTATETISVLGQDSNTEGSNKPYDEKILLDIIAINKGLKKDDRTEEQKAMHKDHVRAYLRSRLNRIK